MKLKKFPKILLASLTIALLPATAFAGSDPAPSVAGAAGDLGVIVNNYAQDVTTSVQIRGGYTGLGSYDLKPGMEDTKNKTIYPGQTDVEVTLAYKSTYHRVLQDVSLVFRDSSGNVTDGGFPVSDLGQYKTKTYNIDMYGSSGKLYTIKVDVSPGGSTTNPYLVLTISKQQ